MAKKKSVVKKSILRKICTKKYETVDIHVEIEEQIEWENEKEKLSETGRVSKFLLTDFVKTHDMALSELGVDRCIAQVTTTSENMPKKKGNSEKEDPLDFLDE
tara:strand:+ start:46306 stop:46614 length:309 start_codon:yes stop_codon:yes gene_type:complete